MTVGASPSYAEVFLNFQDSSGGAAIPRGQAWLDHLKAELRGNLTFAGDNTWLDLFPETFDRSQGYNVNFAPV